MRFMMMMIPAVYVPGALAEPHTADLLAEMMRYNESLADAGVLRAMDGLQPPELAVRLAFKDRKSTLTDGPFAEAKEALGGYWLIEVASKAEAVAWAARCPAQDGDVIELRPLVELSDFAPGTMPPLSPALAKIAPQYQA
jgi:hypothetical protein